MASRQPTYHTGDEPIDGYRLVDFLGAGQFGEVWKAADLQTGRQVAIKFIDLTHSPSALKEVKAFNLVKQLNHPNLVPIVTARLQDRNNRPVSFDDAQDTARLKLRQVQLKDLIIVMGLGEKSLSARLKELNPDGTPPDRLRGLPAEELLEYMDGAARGIDYLNKPVHNLPPGIPDGPIVHCDIKPDNMMIVSGQVQIADCGVAVVVTADVRKTQAAGSPAYSPVELTLNRPGPTTDQYSLAVSYYELRTGRLPFPDDISAMEVMIRHQRGELDFADPQLTDGERRVLRYATAPKADQRYPSCTDFVKQLRRAADGLKPLSASEVSKPKLPSDASTPRPPSEPRGPFADRPGGSMVDFSDIPPTDHGEPEPPPRIGLNTAGSVGEYVVDDRPVGESGIVGPGRPRQPAVAGLQATAMPTAEERGALTSTPGVGGTLPVLGGPAAQPAGLKKWLLVGAGAGALTLGVAGGAMYLANRPSATFDAKVYTELVGSRLAPLTPAAFESAFQFIAEKEVVPHPEAPEWAAKERDGMAKAADRVAGNPSNWAGPDPFTALRKFLDELDGRYGLKPAAAELRQKHLRPAAERRLTELLKPADPKGFADAQQFVAELAGLGYAKAWAEGYKGELAKTAPKVRDGLLAASVADLNEKTANDAAKRYDRAREFVAKNADLFPDQKAAVSAIEAAGSKLLVELVAAKKLNEASEFLYGQSPSDWKSAEKAKLQLAIRKADRPFDPVQANKALDDYLQQVTAGSLTDARKYLADQPGAPDEYLTAARLKVDTAARKQLLVLLQPLTAAAPGTPPAVEVLRAARKYVADQQAAKPFDPPADEVAWANDELRKAARTALQRTLPPVSAPFPEARGRLDAVAALAAALAGPDIGIDLGSQAKKDIADRAGEVLKAGLAKRPAVALPDVGPAQAFVRDAYRLAELRGGMAADVDDTRWALLDDILKLPGDRSKVLVAAAGFATGSGPALPDEPRKKIGGYATATLDGILNAEPNDPEKAAAQVAAGRKFLTGPDAPLDWKSAVPADWLTKATETVDAAPAVRVGKYLEAKTPAGFNSAWVFLAKLLDTEKAAKDKLPEVVREAALAALKAELSKPTDPAAGGLAFVKELQDAPAAFKTEATKTIAGPAAAFARKKVGNGSPANVADLRGYVEKHQPALGKDWADPLLVVANVGEADWAVDEKLKDETAAAVDAATGYIKSRKGQLPADWEPAAAARVRKVQDGRDAVLKPIEALLGKDTLKDLDEAERQAERTLVGAKFAADLAGVKRRLPGLREDVQDKELRAAVKRLADDKQPTADKLTAALAEFREPERQRKFAARVVGMASQPEQAGWQPIAAAELRSRRLLDPLEPDARKRTAEWHYRHLARTVGEPARAGLKGLAADGSAETAKAALDKLAAELAAAGKEPAWKDVPADPELTTLAGLGQAWQDAMAGRAGLRPLKELLLKGAAGEYAPALRKQYVTAAAKHVPDPAARVADLRELRDKLTGSDRLTFDADFQPVLTDAVKELVRAKVPAANELDQLVGKDAEANTWAAVALAEVNPSAPLPAAVPDELSAYRRYVSAVRKENPAEAAAELAAVYANREAVPDVLKADGRKKAAGGRLAKACDGALMASLVNGPKVLVKPDADKRVPAWLKAAAELTNDDLMRVRAAVVEGGDPELATVVKASPEEVAKWTALSVGERAVYCGRWAEQSPAKSEARGRGYAAAADLLHQWHDEERQKRLADQLTWPKPESKEDEEKLKKRSEAELTEIRTPVWDRLKAWAGDADPQTDGYHRLTLARGRMAAESPIPFRSDLADVWQAVTASLGAAKPAAVADYLGPAALLGTNRLFVFPADRLDARPPAPEVVAVWAEVFALADRALADKPDNYHAHRAVGTLLRMVQQQPTRFEPIAKAAADAANGAAAKRLVPTDPDELLAAREQHACKAADRPPYPIAGNHLEHALVLFELTGRRVAAHRVTGAEVAQAMTAVVGRGKQALAQKVGDRIGAYKLMGIAAEDVAWQGGKDREKWFADALRYLDDALAAAEKYEAEAADAMRPGARSLKYQVQVDRGRCLYRAAVYAPGGKWTAAAAADELGRLTDPVGLPAAAAPFVAEARYFHGRALWAAGQTEAALAAYKAAAGTETAGDVIWRWLAVYDTGRLAAAARPDKAADIVKEAAAALKEQKRATYDDLLFALAELDTDRDAAALKLANLAYGLLDDSNKNGRGDQRASEPFQHAMAELTVLWESGAFGDQQRVTEAVRKRLTDAYAKAREEYPWVLVPGDKPVAAGKKKE